MAKNAAIVLVGPKGDANIGAVARAMKNFDLSDLRIVDGIDHLTKPAYMWAVDAKNILEAASTFTTLDSALAGSTSTVAFTRRLGKLRKQHMEIAEACRWITRRMRNGKVALIFGREDKGLSNDELKRCDITVTIPTSKKLPSMNLAQSVVIACYELFKNTKHRDPKPSDPQKQEFLSRQELASLMDRIDEMLASLNYENTAKNPLKSKILHQFGRLFGRAGLTLRDLRMFEGLIARIIK